MVKRGIVVPEYKDIIEEGDDRGLESSYGTEISPEFEKLQEQELQ